MKWRGEGEKWTELGEVVMHIARRVSLPFSDRHPTSSADISPPGRRSFDCCSCRFPSQRPRLSIIVLIALGCVLSIRGATRDPNCSTLRQGGQLACSAGSLLQDWRRSVSFSALTALLLSCPMLALTCFRSSTDKGYSDHSLRLLNLLPTLSRLRALPSVSPSSLAKIDKLLDRLRYVVARWMRGEKRVDQLMRTEGEKAPEIEEDERKRREVGRRILEGLVAYCEGMHRAAAGNVSLASFPSPASTTLMQSSDATALLGSLSAL